MPGDCSPSRNVVSKTRILRCDTNDTPFTGDAPVVRDGGCVRLALRRVFVYLPLVGENEDGDEKNERARGRKLREQLCGYACLRGRHRIPTMHGPATRVKWNKRT